MFSQQDDGLSQNPIELPEANVGPSPSMAVDQQGYASQSAEVDHLGTPSMAEGLAECSSALTVQQLQRQLQELRSALNTQASQLQVSEAGREYIHRLLNAVTAEPNHLLTQLDSQNMLKSASDLKHDGPGSASAKVSVAQPVPEGLLGLQPATSQISAMWLTDPSVRRSLLPKYGLEGKPYARDGPALEGAESIMGPCVADSLLSEVSTSGGAQGGLTPGIGRLAPGSGAFGAALAAAERASVTPSRRVGRSLSHDGSFQSPSLQTGVSPSKASWTSLLRWGSRHLPLMGRGSETSSQPGKVSEHLYIDQQESQYLNQYRAVLDAQRHSNTSLSADCEQIQERLDQLGRRRKTSDE